MSVVFVRLVAAMLLFTSVSIAVSNTPSWALSEENLLFLEAWRTIYRAYVDKTFNGQSWFCYRENALRNEPMNNREETHMAIRKMLATLNDPFTRFLEPEKFKSLRSGTQGALTGVGLSIGYPTGSEGSQAGLVVISAAPGGPANRAGISSGDIILEIDNASTESMGIYDAAERLQGPEASSVELTIQTGPEIKHLALIFGALRGNRVNAFVLDRCDNSGGLFPEGIVTAKIWLDKGLIVSAIAASEPLAVLVCLVIILDALMTVIELKLKDFIFLFQHPNLTTLPPLTVPLILKTVNDYLVKIQSVFQLSDGSGLAVTVACYEIPAHNDIDKIGVIPDHPLPNSFRKDEDGCCGCLQDSASACYVNNVQLFSR
ncbi:hypothetical protein REPUB_Repub15cG0034400 [Reevesia pubescens]